MVDNKTVYENYDMEKYVEANPHLVTMKETSYPGVYVLKYKRNVFYDSLWDEYLEECRGTLVDKDFNVISRPFSKIYNYGIEKQAPNLSSETKITACKKINGFMIAVTLYNDDILVSTTGSTDSDYVKMALTLIDREKYKNVCKNWPSYTFMFECVHTNDPHIIPEEPGMYLLGWRKNSWNSDVEYNQLTAALLVFDFDCEFVDCEHTTVGKLLEQVKTVRHEGFVAYCEDGTSFKIKSPYYLVKKFVARNPKTDKLMKQNVKQFVDEEYYPLIEHIQADIESFTLLTEQDRLKFVRKFLES
jgi:hypothetical protein